MLLRDAIGTTLRRLRLSQGKTLRDLAADSNLSLPYLSEIERGRKEASSEILATLTGALDIPLESLMHQVSRELERYESAPQPEREVISLPTRVDETLLLAA